MLMLSLYVVRRVATSWIGDWGLESGVCWLLVRCAVIGDRDRGRPTNPTSSHKPQEPSACALEESTVYSPSWLNRRHR
eukprot:scaffold80752_cov69-Cyclotella_meneghiniana.AAC.4